MMAISSTKLFLEKGNINGELITLNVELQNSSTNKVKLNWQNMLAYWTITSSSDPLPVPNEFKADREKVELHAFI